MSYVRRVAGCALLLLLGGCTALGTDSAEGDGVKLEPEQTSATPGEGGMAGSGAAPDPASPTAAGAPEPGADQTDSDVEPSVDSEGHPVSQVNTTVGSEPGETGEPAELAESAEPSFCRTIDPALVHVAGAGEGAISGCPARTCTGLVDIAKQWETQALGNDPTDLAPYVGCTLIEGDLHVAKHPSADLTQLACLERVTGSVVIWNSPNLLSLHGLEWLTEVDGGFELGMHDNTSMSNDALTSFDALASLRTIGGNFGVAGGPGFQSFGALPMLELVGGDVFFQFFYGADDLSGLNALKIVGGDFNLWRPEGLKHVSGLQLLDTIGGWFVLWGATDLVELDGLPSLACIGDAVNIGGDDAWENNAVLREVHVFPALEKVGGTLILQHNQALESFDMLGAAEQVGELYVHDNAVLSRLALDAVTELRVLDVQDNPQLDSCPLHELATRALPPDSAPGYAGNLACPVSP